MAERSVMQECLFSALIAGISLGCKTTESPGSVPAEPPAQAQQSAVSSPSSNEARAEEGAGSNEPIPEPEPLEAVEGVDEEPWNEVAAGGDEAQSGCGERGTRGDYCLDLYTAPPLQIPQKNTQFDAQGCVDISLVKNSCNGVAKVLAGPTVSEGRCCYRVCKIQPPPCGRPFLDDLGQERKAGLGVEQGAGRAAMSDGLGSWVAPETSVSDIPGDIQALWLDDALMEHASVAAFARFSLELLRVGAPRALVTEARQALGDELVHAQACFALASGGGAGISVGEISLEGVSVATSFEQLVERVMMECCIGETFAALLAERGLEGCAHPAVRRALSRIAGDERRHAELGWKFVAWALAQEGERLQPALLRGLERGLVQLQRAGQSCISVSESELNEYGKLSSRQTRQVAEEATRGLILPLVSTLLARLGFDSAGGSAPFKPALRLETSSEL